MEEVNSEFTIVVESDLDKYELIESHELNVPGVDAERHLLAFKPK